MPAADDPECDSSGEFALGLAEFDEDILHREEERPAPLVAVEPQQDRSCLGIEPQYGHQRIVAPLLPCDGVPMDRCANMALDSAILDRDERSRSRDNRDAWELVRL